MADDARESFQNLSKVDGTFSIFFEDPGKSAVPLRVFGTKNGQDVVKDVLVCVATQLTLQGRVPVRAVFDAETDNIVSVTVGPDTATPKVRANDIAIAKAFAEVTQAKKGWGPLYDFTREEFLSAVDGSPA